MKDFVFPSAFVRFALPILSFNSSLVGLEPYATNAPDPSPYLDSFKQSISDNEDGSHSVTFEIEFPKQKDHFMSIIFLVDKDYHLLSYFVSFYSKNSK